MCTKHMKMASIYGHTICFITISIINNLTTIFCSIEQHRFKYWRIFQKFESMTHKLCIASNIMLCNRICWMVVVPHGFRSYLATLPIHRHLHYSAQQSPSSSFDSYIVYAKVEIRSNYEDVYRTEYYKLIVPSSLSLFRLNKMKREK